MSTVNWQTKLDSIKTFTLPKLKEGGKAICVVLAILVLTGAFFGGLYVIGLGIHKLLGRIGPIPVIIVTGFVAVAAVCALCCGDI